VLISDSLPARLLRVVGDILRERWLAWKAWARDWSPRATLRSCTPAFLLWPLALFVRIRGHAFGADLLTVTLVTWLVVAFYCILHAVLGSTLSLFAGRWSARQRLSMWATILLAALSLVGFVVIADFGRP
jgi:hypothetical protein